MKKGAKIQWIFALEYDRIIVQENREMRGIYIYGAVTDRPRHPAAV